MRAKREPAPPPQIPGFEYVRLLGLGGFADVFEYRQELPRRSVAVKVLLSSSLDTATRERFFVEANLMAQLSHHPSIVTIYHADIAADGRPFLVMEYCSRPGLGGRYRTERIGVDEALRTGIRLASAVEAAHRRGILHRDIKPANILTTDYGWPALTDFGIAATTGGEGSAGTGMSIPWSPPELLAEHPVGDERGDVYSLAATIYSMLAGRSPFEVMGQSNGPADLISRIERSPLSKIDRQDFPAGLEAVLARAMSKDPARRYDSALAMARALQQVERSHGLPLTSIDLSEDVLEETTPREPLLGQDPDAGATRIRPITNIDPGQASTPNPKVEVDQEATRLRPITSVPPATRATQGPQVAPAQKPRENFVAPPPKPEGWTPAGVGEPPKPPDQGTAEQTRKGARRKSTVISGVLAGVFVAAVVGGVALYGIGADRGVAPDPSSEPTRPTVTTSAVPSPVDLDVEMLGDSVRFTWVNPSPEPGDQFLWTEVEVGVESDSVLIDEALVELPVRIDGRPLCIEVKLVRADRRASSQPLAGCSL